MCWGTSFGGQLHAGGYHRIIFTHGVKVAPLSSAPRAESKETSARMTTKGEAFAGLSVAVVTPFKDGEVDYDAFKAQIDFQIEAGTTCICPVGTTGESPTLTHP